MVTALTCKLIPGVFCRNTFTFLLGLAICAASQTTRKAPAPPRKVGEDPQLYRNSTFNFRYEIPYGWVDRTNDTRDEKPAELPGEKAGAKNDVLLAAFERPPEAAGEGINSAVVIAAESAGAYPGLKRAEEFLGPLTEFAIRKGFKAEGDPATVEIDGRELARADFSKPLNEKVTMHQSTLVALVKGQVVSFNFAGGSRDEIDDLVDRLHFGPAKAPAR